MILKPKNQKNVRHVLAPEPSVCNEPTITTPEAWQEKRAGLSATLLDLLGEWPQTPPPTPQFKVLEEHEEADYRQLLISYEAEPGEEVRAHLLIPPLEKRLLNDKQQGAAVLCLHGTSDVAKDTQLGAGKPGRGYGKFLAQAGFITISPDHVCSGDRLPAGFKAYDTTPFYERHPNCPKSIPNAWDVWVIRWVVTAPCGRRLLTSECAPVFIVAVSPPGRIILIVIIGRAITGMFTFPNCAPSCRSRKKAAASCRLKCTSLPR
jgi:hypothetical protein